MDRMKAWCASEKIRAVGEIGLDYYWEEPEHEIQKKWFAAQLDLAKELKLPVIIHSRDAAKDTLDIMKAEHAEELGGVIHCFSYTKEMAREYLNMGFYLGIGGVLTFKMLKAGRGGRICAFKLHCTGNGLPLSGSGAISWNTQFFPESGNCSGASGTDQGNRPGNRGTDHLGKCRTVIPAEGELN